MLDNNEFGFGLMFVENSDLVKFIAIFFKIRFISRADMDQVHKHQCGAMAGFLQRSKLYGSPEML